MTDAAMVRGEGFAPFLSRVQWFLVSLVVVAWPWEVFQRIPLAGTTIVKAAGGALLLCVGFEWVLRRRIALRTSGLEWPLGAFILVCVVTSAASSEPGISWRISFTYATYVGLFYALLHVVRNPADTVIQLRLFTGSALLVALLAILCSAQILAPTWAEFTRQTGERVSVGGGVNTFLRVAATAPDFNQGVLPLLAALPFILFALPEFSRGKVGRFARWCAMFLLVGGMVAAFSRSSVAVAGAVFLVFMVVGLRKGGVSKRGLLLFAFAALLLLPLALPYAESFVDRARRGLSGEEASIAHRLYVYERAASLVPSHLFFGTGLGTSDAAIATVSEAEAYQGLTLHSVPFKMLLETGIFGLAAFLWLCIRAFVLIATRYATTDRSLRLAFLCMGGALFAVSCVQPFTQLSLFPILAALALGSIARPLARGVGDGVANRRAFVPAAAAVVCVVIVALNYIGYQRFAGRLNDYGDRMAAGLEQERRGEWLDAHAAYVSARASLGDRASNQHGYYALAYTVADFELLFEMLAAGRIDPTPEAASYYASGRAGASAGALDDATGELAAALELEPDYAEAAYLLGEVQWNSGAFREAVESFQLAKEAAELGGNGPYREFRDELVASLVERTGGISDLDDLVTLRRLGRWEEAIVICKDALDSGETTAHTLFYLGADAEIRHDREEALSRYGEALEQSGDHDGARRRIDALRSVDDAVR